jgi:GTPase
LSIFNRSSDDEFTRGAKAIIVYPELNGRGGLSPELKLDEAEGLASAIGIDVVARMHLRLRKPRAATLIGGGQIEQICSLIEQTGAELLIIDSMLSAIQQRNLEEKTKLKTIDRTGIILEIFGERAATAEGRLQVELAHLDYQAGRLVRSWTHLERQRGGFGFLGGPGETQIEADRRMIRNRMAKLRRELEEVKRTRGLHRKSRQKAPWPVIALVGYTNAGKSTLFNRLTGADILAEDMLFATLDPTMRETSLSGNSKVILSDTVGFVSDLPTQLVAAFRATLEEVISADIIVHVRDISHPATEQQRNDVLSILNDIGINGEDVQSNGYKPFVEAWNKIDKLSFDDRASMLENSRSHELVVPMSAQTGEGIDLLRSRLEHLLTLKHRHIKLRFDAEHGALNSWLHRHGKITNFSENGDKIDVEILLDRRQIGAMAKHFAGLFHVFE